MLSNKLNPWLIDELIAEGYYKIITVKFDGVERKFLANATERLVWLRDNELIVYAEQALARKRENAAMMERNSHVYHIKG